MFLLRCHVQMISSLTAGARMVISRLSVNKWYEYLSESTLMTKENDQTIATTADVKSELVLY